MRNLRIRQLLLLLIRTAIILLLVLAFARPTLQSGSGGLLSERSNIEAVIVLDNSMSLSESRLSGTLLDELRARFNSLQDAFRAGDRITVIQSTAPAATLIKQEPFESGVWERSIQKLQPNYLKTDVNSAISQAISLLDQSVFATKELYVISDFQQSGIDSRSLTELFGQPENTEIQPFLLPIAHAEAENISIDSVTVVNRLVEINQPLHIKAYFRNHHPENHLNTLASVSLNNNRVAQQQVSIAPNELKEVQFQLTLAENGFVNGFIETESDALQEDNRRYFNFYVPKRVQLLHITPSGDFRSFLPLILNPAIDRDVFGYQRELAANWSSRNFLEYDVIILEGLDQLPETLISRLKSFVEQGGGAIVLPGDRIVPPQYNRLLEQFSLGKLGELQGSPGSVGQFLTIENFRWNHPVFEGLFEEKPGQLNPIEVYANFRVSASLQSQDLLQLSDRSPLLLESNLNKGVIYFISSPMQPQWNQLPTKGFVVPLLYRLVYFAGTRKISDRQEIRTGEIYQSQFSSLEAPYEFRMSLSQETDVRLTPGFRGSNVLIEFAETALPGNYRLQHNNQQIAALSVNPWPAESDARYFSDELPALFPGSRLLANDTPIADQVQSSRFGQELWRYLLIAAFVLLLVEMVVARTGSKSLVEESAA